MSYSLEINGSQVQIDNMEISQDQSGVEIFVNKDGLNMNEQLSYFFQYPLNIKIYDNNTLFLEDMFNQVDNFSTQSGKYFKVDIQQEDTTKRVYIRIVYKDIASWQAQLVDNTTV